MSAHQCCLQGSLFLKKGTTDDAIETALAPLLEDCELDFSHELTQGTIEHQEDPDRLNLSLEFWGSFDSELDATVDRLHHLVEKPGYLVMIDYDAGDKDRMVTPQFIGETLREQNAARVDYAIDQCTRWLGNAVDVHALSSIRDHIHSFEPLGTLSRAT